MKKNKLLLIVLILALGFNVNAQLGVKLGYNFAKTTGDVEDGYSEKFLNNVHMGAFMEKDLIPLLDIRFGVDYSPKGYKIENGDDYEEMKINYIEIPIQAKVKLGPIYALGGVYGAYALGGNIDTKEGAAENSIDLDFDNHKIKRLDYGMKFGAGFQTGIGPLKVYAQTEYSFGVQNISDFDGVEIKNKVLSLSVGAIIGF